LEYGVQPGDTVAEPADFGAAAPAVRVVFVIERQPAAGTEGPESVYQPGVPELIGDQQRFTGLEVRQITKAQSCFFLEFHQRLLPWGRAWFEVPRNAVPETAVVSDGPAPPEECDAAAPLDDNCNNGPWWGVHLGVTSGAVGRHGDSSQLLLLSEGPDPGA
jgi:hypothetical protein